MEGDRRKGRRQKQTSKNNHTIHVSTPCQGTWLEVRPSQSAWSALSELGCFSCDKTTSVHLISLSLSFFMSLHGTSVRFTADPLTSHTWTADRHPLPNDTDASDTSGARQTERRTDRETDRQRLSLVPCSVTVTDSFSGHSNIEDGYGDVKYSHEYFTMPPETSSNDFGCFWN